MKPGHVYIYEFTYCRTYILLPMSVSINGTLCEHRAVIISGLHARQRLCDLGNVNKCHDLGVACDKKPFECVIR